MIEYLRLFDRCRHGSRVLGPGLRYVIWTQGCGRKCPGCVTPESRDWEGGMDFSLDELVDDILQRPYIDGLTVSGGEPFLQAAALGRLLEMLQLRRPDLTVLIYTGYRMEELARVESAQQVLKYTDVLIDGEYIRELDDGKGIRGSSNQRVLSLTGRLQEFVENMEEMPRRLEWVATTERSLTSIGVPDLLHVRRGVSILKLRAAEDSKG